MSISSMRKIALLSTIAYVALVNSPACAAGAEVAANMATSDGPAASEDAPIIVSATRHEQALQDVAVAVTALSARNLSDAGVRDIQQLTQVAPSLHVPMSENAGSVTARVRGIGTQGSNPGLESSVGVFVDGVYRARNGVAFGDLGELAAVEVLRGPQGTLFGRNTSAGLISITTQKPSFEPGANVEVNLGNFDAGGIAGSITGPLSDTVAYRFFVANRFRDGYLTMNRGTNAEFDTNDQNYWTMRGQLLFQPNDQFDARLIIDQTRRTEACCASVVFMPDRRAFSTTAIINNIASTNGAGFPGQLTANSQASLSGTANRANDQVITDGGISLEMNWTLDNDVTITSVSARRKWDGLHYQDADFTGIDVTRRTLNNIYRTLTQEVRVAGVNDRLDWLVGGFYSNETIDRHDWWTVGADYSAYIGALLSGASGPTTPAAALATVPSTSLAAIPTMSFVGTNPAFVNGGGIDDVYRQNANSWALFTHNIYQVTDRLSLTLGLRYTSENKDFHADYSTHDTLGCRALEARFGYNPAAGAGLLSSSLVSPVGTVCLPWQRSALDSLDHVQSRSEKQVSGIFTAAYAFSDDINAYLSFSRGYKAGGFNLDRAFADGRGSVVSGGTSVLAGAVTGQTVRGADTSFAPETVEGFELGLKTQFFDRALTINGAVYYQTFTDFQLNTYNGISFIVASVPEVVSQGLELDWQWRTPVSGLSVGGGYAYTDAQYGTNLGWPSVAGSFLANNPNSYLLPGAQLTSSPKNSLSLHVNYRANLAPNLAANFYADSRTISDSVVGSNLDPRKTQPGFSLFNAKVSLSNPNGPWEIEFWGRNLGDEHYAQIIFDSPLQGDSAQLVASGSNFVARPITSQLNAFLGDPRTFGITFRLHY